MMRDWKQTSPSFLPPSLSSSLPHSSPPSENPNFLPLISNLSLCLLRFIDDKVSRVNSHLVPTGKRRFQDRFGS
ncbi:hypothetical protein IGI04_025754 [Brassica rapa subsp. trilocularis]|uniref:Uncharacterized protein n=1 Tax=Brassica rapa subsp. trilocularis TaxID=1813537 RepID=A0ABQ7KUA5_BRACM|nr:hypothetical protein IGI04_025754 [Brassica rapa subsp. trilocularis]